MQPSKKHSHALGKIPMGLLAVWLSALAKPAAASPTEPYADWLTLTLLGLIALLLAASLTLATLAYRRSRQPAPPSLSLADLEEMRRSVSAFAKLLREGSAMLLQNHHATLEAVERVAAHSQQLIALVAGCEERMTNATARSEILATRVARSAAAEIKSTVESLTGISARIEYQARALEEATRPVGARAA